MVSTEDLGDGQDRREGEELSRKATVNPHGVFALSETRGSLVYIRQIFHQGKMGLEKDKIETYGQDCGIIVSWSGWSLNGIVYG